MNRARSSSDQKPPLAVSRRLRPRRGRPEPPVASRTPPAASPKETLHPRRSSAALGLSPLETEYEKISRELKALAKRAHGNFPNGDALQAIALSAEAGGVMSSPVFERGRLYEVYSARRDERLKRKMEVTFEKEAEVALARSAVDAEVVVKRRSTTRTDSLRTSLRSSTRESKMTSALRSAVKYAQEEGMRASALSARCK